MKKSYDRKFKSRAALEVLLGDLTVAEIAGRYQFYPILVQQGKKTLQKSACYTDFLEKVVQPKGDRRIPVCLI